MANEKRLIDANELLEKHTCDVYGAYDDSCMVQAVFVPYIKGAPTVDAVPVDEIRVDFMSLCLENQEAILSVSICGKPNEVKLPFSKEVAEVVHGRWVAVPSSDMMTGKAYKCSECKKMRYGSWMPNYCPNCGAKMDGDGNV